MPEEAEPRGDFYHIFSLTQNRHRLFNLFKRKAPQPNFRNLVYSTTAGKQTACVQRAMNEPGTVFVAWFPATVADFKALFTSHQIDEKRVTDVKGIGTSHAPASLVMLEHYPLAQKENEFLSSLGRPSTDVYLSLEEPLLRHFGGDRIAALMLQMGMKADEVIQHPMIDKSIINAQEKLAERNQMEQTARSQSDWFLRNTGESEF